MRNSRRCSEGGEARTACAIACGSEATVVQGRVALRTAVDKHHLVNIAMEADGAVPSVPKVMVSPLRAPANGAKTTSCVSLKRLGRDRLTVLKQFEVPSLNIPIPPKKLGQLWPFEGDELYRRESMNGRKSSNAS